MIIQGEVIMIIANDLKKEEVRKSYKAVRTTCDKDIDICLGYLFKMQQSGLIHYLIDMDNITTVEKQYILSLSESNM